MSTTYARERTLQDEIAPAVERGVPGVEVLAVELLSPSRFCVYVDHPEGVDHALCARITRLLDAYRGDYTIDVSSPGSERPLRKPEHFASAVGRRVAVRTESRIAGRDRFKGELVDAADGAVLLASAGGPDPLRIPYDAIVRANLIDEG
ncbi:MAG: ribosome maturation factor RimP [Actinobacteria bacterium]|nr:ribosome maturation factor RimP [Actinomycetota bacterium]